MTSLLRAKYFTLEAFTQAASSKRTAVVCASTSGIGQACANRLAEQGYTVIAIGRDRPGRAEAVTEELTLRSKSALKDDLNYEGEFISMIPQHEFYPCDAFSLKSIQDTTSAILAKHPVVDALVMTQGMATTQSFTPTTEGNDEKLTLHYYSRMAMIQGLLPGLRQSKVKGGAVVLSVLSGGVHSAYKEFRTDPTLKKNYSIQNAANAAGFYNDLGLDYYALDSKNSNINFVHASPGFVKTNWGTEFGSVLRSIVRMMQTFGRKPSDCAEYMLASTVFASDAGDALPERLDSENNGLFVMGENGQSKSLTKEHSKEARDFVWSHTVEVLKKSGINSES